MNTYKITHFNHHRAVLEHFLKVGEARLYKVFDFARFGASTQDHSEILGSAFLGNSWLEKLKNAISSIKKDQ